MPSHYLIQKQTQVIVRAFRTSTMYRSCHGWQLTVRIYMWCRMVGLTVDMMTSSNGNIFRVTGPLCGEFTGPGEFPAQRPVTRSFDVFFDLRLNKRLSKRPWGWWFETPVWSLWRHRNGIVRSLFARSHPTTPILLKCTVKFPVDGGIRNNIFKCISLTETFWSSNFT